MNNGLVIPDSIARPWSWRCTDCDRHDNIDDPAHWTDIVLFVFERHWHRGHMIELWPTGERSAGMYAWRVVNDPGSPVAVGPSAANMIHGDFTTRDSSTND